METLDQFKGIKDLYDNACNYFANEKFYKWLDSTSFEAGLICTAPAWYEKNNRWYLVTDKADPINEEDSTFFAREYPISPGSNPPKDGTVLHFFGLEKDENLVATHGKRRPVVLLKHYESSWFNKFYPKKGWLCLPIFGYHSRHEQSFVQNDQRLNTTDRVYMPCHYKDNPGLDKESAIHLGSMQLIEDKYLDPKLKHNQSLNKDMRYGVSEFALKMIIMHMMQNIGILDAFISRESSQDKTAYECFQLYVNELMDETIKEVSK